jgi:hypothetical protein
MRFKTAVVSVSPVVLRYRCDADLSLAAVADDPIERRDRSMVKGWSSRAIWFGREHDRTASMRRRRSSPLESAIETASPATLASGSA